MAERALTYAEVAEHKSKRDLYVVVHDKVYDTSSFVDEHPGGEEVMIDVAGQDATDSFEDVGHSDEAREILEGLKIGTLKRLEGDPKPSTSSIKTASFDPKAFQSAGAGLGIGLYLFLLVGGAAAYYGYQYMQKQQQRV